jgi:PAS domain S-box-containing protein
VKLSLERKIALGFGAALFVLLLVTAAAWWNVAQFQGTHYWVERTREGLSRLERTLSDVLAMQASTRGFVLTGSDEVLAPFQESSARLEASLTELRRLMANRPDQNARLARLEPLAARAREIMLGRIAARNERGLEAATETAAYLDGQRTVETFRQVIREMAEEERRLLDDRLDRAKKFGRLTVFTIVGASILATGSMLAAARVVRRDLLLRRKAEADLHESFARVEDLYNNAPCGYHSLDHTGTFVAINDTALRWLGYTRKEVIRRLNYVDILMPESAATFRQRFATFMQTGAVANVEYEWRRKDGTILPVLLNATAIYDLERNYVASRATVFDLTERKRIEAERDRYFTVSRDLLWIATLDGCFKRVNPAWEQTLGFGAEELIARPCIDFVHRDDRERAIAELTRLAAGDESPVFEVRFLCKDGSHRWLRWSARAAVSENLIYASARDVTDQRRADEHIRWLNADLGIRAAELEAANRELESFSYSVSHDLRAPLRHIDGFASLLDKRAASLDAESKRYLATISKSAKQMGTLIDDLLALSRIGRVPLRRELVNQNQLVAEVIANGRHNSEHSTIAWDIGPLPEVRADGAMLRQVWANLIDNAVKYSSKVHGPRIAIEGRVDATTGEYVFSIRDNGVGFDMTYADKLFGVFQRLHGPTEFEGTGIGLANVRRIVNRHGGRTWAEGRVDEGATFHFSIPINVSSGSSSQAA